MLIYYSKLARWFKFSFYAFAEKLAEKFPQTLRNGLERSELIQNYLITLAISYLYPNQGYDQLRSFARETPFYRKLANSTGSI